MRIHFTATRKHAPDLGAVRGRLNRGPSFARSATEAPAPRFWQSDYAYGEASRREGRSSIARGSLFSGVRSPDGPLSGQRR
jgi:hypothetical protein